MLGCEWICFYECKCEAAAVSLVDDSRFLQPKEMILKAMNIACANTQAQAELYRRNFEKLGK